MTKQPLWKTISKPQTASYLRPATYAFLLLPILSLFLPALWRQEPPAIQLHQPPTPTHTPLPTPTATPGPVVVYVAGAVAQPQLVRLPADRRIHDAIEAAGGFTDQADRNAINLADWIYDGLQIYIPSLAEAHPTPQPNRNPARQETQTPQNSGLIDINSASLPQLDALPGIGPAKAQAIINHRPYQTIQELLNVPGIGPATLTKFQDQITAR